MIAEACEVAICCLLFLQYFTIFQEVMKSEGLKHFINLVLLAGNFMGRTKNSKDAFAFELGVLNRVNVKFSHIIIFKH